MGSRRSDCCKTAFSCASRLVSKGSGTTGGRQPEKTRKEAVIGDNDARETKSRESESQKSESQKRESKEIAFPKSFSDQIAFDKTAVDIKKFIIAVGTVDDRPAQKSVDGKSNGTTIIVRNLFYNTLPRKKFLKQPQTEGSYVADLMEHFPLSRCCRKYRNDSGY